MIIVVGIGADGMAGLAPPPRDELRRAAVIYGSRRQLDLLDDSVRGKRREWPSPMLPALGTLLDGVEGDVHVVASGDPLLHGIGSTPDSAVRRRPGAVLPHVSSVTLACSRVGWAVQDTEVISLVTAEPHTAVRRGGQAVVMSRDGAPRPRWRGCSPTYGRGDSEIRCSSNSADRASGASTATARDWATRPPERRHRRPQRHRRPVPAR